MQLAAFARRAPPDFDEDGFPDGKLTATEAERNAMIRRRFALESAFRAPVAQWIEQPPPKGQVGRSIRLWGAKTYKKTVRGADMPYTLNLDARSGYIEVT